MVLDDRLSKDLQRTAKDAAAPDPYYAEEPDWLIYKDRDKQPWLNKDRGVFTETDKNAINKAPSVFEAATVFDTRNG
ncbi:MAG: hypothetical protein J5966_09730 [Lachnospiraceae bacterium]|nr:hypothetical protein [Lachnospiraceae bacterium]